MGCGGVWQSDANAALDESMRCNPNTHSYSYTYSDGYTDGYAYSYAHRNAYVYAHSYCYTDANSYSYNHRYADAYRYSQTYAFTKIQSVAKDSSHSRATAVDVVGRRRCSSQAFGHRGDRRWIRG